MPDKTMKIICGGSMGFKKTGRAYENVDATTYFSIEKEVPADWPREELTKFFDKVNTILAEEATKKMVVAYKTYKEKVVELERLLDEGKI